MCGWVSLTRLLGEGHPDRGGTGHGTVLLNGKRVKGSLMRLNAAAFVQQQDSPTLEFTVAQVQPWHLARCTCPVQCCAHCITVAMVVDRPVNTPCACASATSRTPSDKPK